MKEIEINMGEIFVEISEVKRVEPERERCRSSRSIQLPRHLKDFNIDFNIQARLTVPNTELFRTRGRISIVSRNDATYHDCPSLATAGP